MKHKNEMETNKYEEDVIFKFQNLKFKNDIHDKGVRASNHACYHFSTSVNAYIWIWIEKHIKTLSQVNGQLLYMIMISLVYDGWNIAVLQKMSTASTRAIPTHFF